MRSGVRKACWVACCVSVFAGCGAPTTETGGHAAIGGSSGTGGVSGAGVGGQSGSAGSAGFSGVGGSGGYSAVGGTGGFGGVPCGVAYERPVDVLFVIDDSGSMRQEQAALRVQIPRLIDALTSGTTATGASFSPVKDLHVGVVSTDMGLPGVPGRSQLGCGDESRLYGGDGVLRNAPNPAGAPGVICAQQSPLFLGYERTGDDAVDQLAASQLARDFACIASLGTAGCGFEMQLEAALRALWPSDSNTLDGFQELFADGRPFMDGTMSGKEAPRGPNTGFLRTNPYEPSLLAIVIVTDEEDCSSHTVTHFTPEQSLPAEDPLRSVGLLHRCFHEAKRLGEFPQGEDARDRGEANLFATTRYAQGFQGLRPGRGDLVLFSVIAGVPVDLVDERARAVVDFNNANARNAYYDAILNDPRMAEAPDPNGPPSYPTLLTSCARPAVEPITGQQQIDAQGNPVTQNAFPPRRLVKVAKEIGANTVIQSICQDDFTPAMDVVLARVGEVIRNECGMGR